ncbi:MAG: molybdenum cofactor biosynthesis protein MoaE [Acidimicrobiia bacterium]
MGATPINWRVSISAAALDPGRLLAEVGDPSAGAVVLFLGTARDHSEDKDGITHLEYEAYPELVEEKFAEVAIEACERWPVVRLSVEHRVGEVAVGQPSVAVAVSCPHRDDAFAAGRYVIDELKRRAPIWKKEHWPGGGDWVQGA